MAEIPSTTQNYRIWLRCRSCGYHYVIIPELAIIEGEMLVPISCRDCQRLYEIPANSLACPISESHHIELFSINTVDSENKELEGDLDKIFGVESSSTKTSCCRCPSCGQQLIEINTKRRV